jgi:HEAT repeat protein
METILPQIFRTCSSSNPPKTSRKNTDAERFWLEEIFPMMQLRFLFLLVFVSAAFAVAPPVPHKPHGRSLEQWLADLESDSHFIREEALDILAMMGAEAKSALPRLRKMLTDKNQTLRTRAATAIWAISGESEPLLKALREDLASPNREVRAAAMRLASQMGTESLPVIDLLLKNWQNGEYDFFFYYSLDRYLDHADFLSQPTFRKILASLDERSQKLILDHARNRKKNLVAKTRPQLKDPSLAIRFKAADFLWRMDCQDKEVIAVFCEYIQSTDPPLLEEQIEFLANFAADGSTPSKALLPVVEVALKRKETALRLHGARMLQQIEGPECKPDRVLPIFLEAIKDEHHSLWGDALHGIAELDSAVLKKEKSLLPRLMQMFEMDEALYSSQSMTTIFTKFGTSVIATFIDRLKTESLRKGEASQCEGVGSVIARLGKPAVRPVAELLAHEDPRIRLTGLQVLAQFDSLALEVVDKIQERLDDRDDKVRDAAIGTIGAIQVNGTEMQPAIAKLLKLARKENADTQTSVLKTLLELQVKSPEALALAVEKMTSSAEQTREAALDLLMSIDPKRKEVLAALSKMLDDERTCCAALRRLGQLGSRAAPLVDKIANLTKSRFPQHAYTARETLEAIGEVPKWMHEQFLADLRKGQIDLRWSFSKIRVDPREVMPYWIEILRSAQYEIFPPTGYTDKVSTIFGSLNRYGEEAKDAAEPLLRIMNNRMQPLRACEINASVNPSDQVIPRVFWAQTWRLTIKFTSSESL